MALNSASATQQKEDVPVDFSDAGDSQNKRIHWNTLSTTKRTGPHASATLRSTLSPIMLEVLRDQAARGQVLVLSEIEAETRCPDFVVASLGAIRKEKLVVSRLRVWFDGTHAFFRQQAYTYPRPGTGASLNWPQAGDA